jgi:hypothetical protein
MTNPELKKAVQDILPELIAEDPQVRDFVLRTVSNYYASREATESRFDRIMAELQRDREEQSRQWDQQHQENLAILARMDQEREDNNRKWEAQRLQNQEFLARMDQEREDNNRKWEAQHQENMATFAELQRHDSRYESTIGALGSRWGLYSEASFRNALKGILEDSFGVQVLNVVDFDEAGEVFGRPDQVEVDLIIKNGEVIVCEIKSSLSKSEMYNFDRKVAFYQKRHDRPVSRKLVISPMVDQRALPMAEALGIEVYSYADVVGHLADQPEPEA